MPTEEAQTKTLLLLRSAMVTTYLSGIIATLCYLLHISTALTTRATCPDVYEMKAPQSLYVKFKALDDSIKTEVPLVSKYEAESAPMLRWNIDNLHYGYYTILMVDPDAPSHENPIMSEWLHWMVVNVPDSGIHIESGNTIMEYKGPSPPKETGDHRYCLYVFKQADYDFNLRDYKLEKRAKFNTKTFLEQNGGRFELIASNVFKSNHDYLGHQRIEL